MKRIDEAIEDMFDGLRVLEDRSVHYFGIDGKLSMFEREYAERCGLIIEYDAVQDRTRLICDLRRNPHLLEAYRAHCRKRERELFGETLDT